MANCDLTNIVTMLWCLFIYMSFIDLQSEGMSIFFKITMLKFEFCRLTCMCRFGFYWLTVLRYEFYGLQYLDLSCVEF